MKIKDDLVQRDATKNATWTRVEDGLPESGKRVLFAWRNSHGKARVSAGYWVAKHSIEAEGEDFESDCDYVEDTDTYYRCEGWCEEGWETEYRADMRDPVTHWMPMPRHPEPAPEGGKS